MNVMKMQPSRKEPIMDPEGLWYVRGKGVMIARVMMKMNIGGSEVVMEWIMEIVMDVGMLSSQEKPGTDPGGL